MECQIKCIFGQHYLTTTTSWIKKNGRVYCDTCQKSFDFEWQEEYNKTVEQNQEQTEEDEIDERDYIDPEGYW
jgi:uncharacterized Zn finger protein (UPF0148 family)